MYTVKFIAISFLTLASVSAQTDSGETFKTGVTVIQVPVTVRDHDGNVVGNLGKDDFQLFDNGKRQEIVSFSVEAPGSKAPDRSLPDDSAKPASSAAADIPERFAAYFFDDVAFRDIGDLTRLRDAATKQLGALQAGDRAAIFTSSCRVAIDFTNDQAKLQAAVARMVLHPTAVCSVARNQKLQLELLKALVHKMANLPGRRDIILISPGFFVGPDRAGEQSSLIDAAARLKVSINAMDILETTGFDPQDAEYGHGPGSYNVATNPEVLAELAHGTGGASVASSDYAASFRKLATPSSRYVLGFISTAKPDGRVHQLKVKLENSHKLTVEARSGYVAAKESE